MEFEKKDGNMPAPDLTKDDIRQIFQKYKVTHIGDPKKGGQKLVLPIEIDEQNYMAKFIQIPPSKFIKDEDGLIEIVDGSLNRLYREIKILQSCQSENLVKIAPYGLNNIEYNGMQLFYYAEENINGLDLSVLYANKHDFSVKEIINLGICINRAINELWNHKIIHRDIKPQNIIYNQSEERFVLIDPGVAFDLNGDSYTQPGFVVGTQEYMSPEQLNPSARRSLDFRSDHFLLGICMYLLATRKHPFFEGAGSIYEVHDNIVKLKHIPAIELNKTIPISLSKLIDRLLSKEPHLRYRNSDLLEKELLSIKFE